MLRLPGVLHVDGSAGGPGDCSERGVSTLCSLCTSAAPRSRGSCADTPWCDGGEGSSCTLGLAAWPSGCVISTVGMLGWGCPEKSGECSFWSPSLPSVSAHPVGEGVWAVGRPCTEGATQQALPRQHQHTHWLWCMVVLKMSVGCGLELNCCEMG